MAESKKLVLVTGGAGFIGSHLCERLVRDGHAVISLDNYFTGSKENHVAGVEYREGHTKDIEKMIPETPDLIYHLGEYSRVEISLTEPALVWDMNIAGTFAVAEFWRKRQGDKPIKLVYAGSSTKFADGGFGRDQSPYAWSKASNTELVRNYGEWYGLPYAITYFYNVYGPGERAGQYGTVIEIFRQKFLKGEPLTVHSPGRSSAYSPTWMTSSRGFCWSPRKERGMNSASVRMSPTLSSISRIVRRASRDAPRGKGKPHERQARCDEIPRARLEGAVQGRRLYPRGGSQPSHEARPDFLACLLSACRRGRDCDKGDH